jgi:hypothetical protein
MATLLEATRAKHEEIERLERLIVTELSREARTHKSRLLQGHRVGAMVDRIVARAAQLVRAGGWPAVVAVPGRWPGPSGPGSRVDGLLCVLC